MKRGLKAGVRRSATLERRVPPRGNALMLAGTVALFASSATAQDGGFALNRFEPAERGSDWFATESLDLRGDGRWAMGIVADWAHDPLVIYDGAGNEVLAVLSEQVYAYLGASVILADRVRIGATFPLVLVNTTGQPVAGVTSLPVDSGANVGDLRLSADVRLLGEYGDVVTLAAGAHVHAPTGSRAAFSGDDRLRLQPHVLASGRLGAFEYAGRTGVNLRARSDFFGAELGNEWVFAAAAGVRALQHRLLVGPELWGGTLIGSSLGAFDLEGTPMELLLGAHYRFERWHVGGGVGPGLSRGLGTPEVRALASLEWIADEREPTFEPTPPRDRDGDGVLDDADACVVEPGVPSPDPKANGCLERTDNDGDGIVDEADACPETRGLASGDRRHHGCPPPDADADSIFDRDDACPNDPGPANADPHQHGCSLPADRDGDGITDPSDACVDEVGEESDSPTRNGCPRVSFQGELLVGLDRIEFENGKESFRPDSEATLEAVARVLSEHPEILRLDIEGHTDAQGQHANNVDLSRRRAAAVKAWLVAHGIAEARLTSHGFGPDRPIDSNDTDAGRQKNRRVEFRVLETDTKARGD